MSEIRNQKSEKILPSLREGSGMGRFKNDIAYSCIDPALNPLPEGGERKAAHA
jgi:hypothetical protein